MSLKTFVSRSFAVQNCIISAIAFALVYNFALGSYLIGYNFVSSIVVGAVAGGLIACAISLVDFMTYHYGREKDFAIFNMMGVVAANTVYNWNVVAHMNIFGWTVRGMIMSTLLGLVCANAYAFSCAAVKKITFEI